MRNVARVSSPVIGEHRATHTPKSSDPEMHRIAVAGGMGQVGRALVNRLADHGHTVFVLSRRNVSQVDGIWHEEFFDMCSRLMHLGDSLPKCDMT